MLHDYIETIDYEGDMKEVCSRNRQASRLMESWDKGTSKVNSVLRSTQCYIDVRVVK